MNSDSEAVIGMRFEDNGFSYLSLNEGSKKWEQLYLNIANQKIPLLVKANSFLSIKISVSRVLDIKEIHFISPQI